MTPIIIPISTKSPEGTIDLSYLGYDTVIHLNREVLVKTKDFIELNEDTDTGWCQVFESSGSYYILHSPPLSPKYLKLNGDVISFVYDGYQPVEANLVDCKIPLKNYA